MLNRLLLPLLFVPAVACGGGDSPTPTPVNPDGPGTPDTPEVVQCAVLDPIGGLTFGSAAMPQQTCMMNGADTPCDFIRAPTMGPNTGMDEFSIAAFLPPEVDGDMDPTDALIVTYVLPFVNNTPKNLDTGGGIATGMSSYQARAIILGDFNQAGMTVQNLYLASSGSITLTQSGVTAGSTIAGSLSMSDFREVDPAAGTDIVDGCKTSFALNFGVLQEAAPAKPGAPGASGASGGDERLRAALQYARNLNFIQMQ